MKPQTFLKYILIFKKKIFFKESSVPRLFTSLGSKNIAPKRISKYPFVVVVAVYMSLEEKTVHNDWCPDVCAYVWRTSQASYITNF